MHKKVGRNDPCPCGSGKKYKNCHLGMKEPEKTHTAAGKRKFKAKVLDVNEKSQDVFNRAASGTLEPGDMQALKFRMTDHDYRGKAKKEAEAKQFEASEDEKKPEPGRMQEAEEVFKPTKKNYQQEGE